MPVTNEYANGSNRARQDFQRGYLYYNGSTGQITVNGYPKCSPGMTSSGWNPTISYKIARYYETHGARNYWGEPSGYAYKVSGKTWRQIFTGGSVAGPISITITESSASPKLTDEGEVEFELPQTFILNQNYPNPFNPTTTISFSLSVTTDVKIVIFNILGQRVVTLMNQQQEAGEYFVTWDASNYSSGIYLYRITAGDAVKTKKMMLLK